MMVSHVDDFIDEPMGTPGERYAKFFFAMFRWPAALKATLREQMTPFKLYCTWNGVPGGQTRFRVTGCSRMGDVWLSSDFRRECGYDHRVDVEGCSEWGPTP